MISVEYAVLAPLALVAFALALQAAGLKVDLSTLLAFLDRQGREGNLLIAFGMLLGFLTALLR